MSDKNTYGDWCALIGYIAFALYFAIAAYGRYRTMFPRP
jgi:hypothetical protein